MFPMELTAPNAEGERQFKHFRCPSLSERRRLRQEALENA